MNTSKDKLRFKGITLLALLFLTVFVVMPTTAAEKKGITSQNTSSYQKNIDKLLTKSLSEDKVTVIVTLVLSKSKYSLNSSSIGGTATKALSATNTRNIAEFTSKLDQKNILSSIQAMKFTPQFIVDINAAGLQELLSNPDVISVVENGIYRPTLAESRPLVQPTPSSGDITDLLYSGQGSEIAIIDTGVEKSHPFFGGRVTREACFSGGGSGLTSLCPGGVGTSTVTGSGEPCSLSGCNHGTHVAGISAGFLNSNFSGVAFSSEIFAIMAASEFDSNPVFSDADLISALNHLIGLESAGTTNLSAVNMSLGGGLFPDYCQSSSLRPAIDTLRSQGVATVIASGNDGVFGAVSSPGCIFNAITVGSTGDTASSKIRVANYSNEGLQLDLYAPGGDSLVGSLIRSSVTGGGYANFQGTSMATPHVAGAFSILKSACRTATVSQIENSLKLTGEPVTEGVFYTDEIFNRIRIEQAVLNLLDTASCPAVINSQPNEFYPTVPCRLVDTRIADNSSPLIRGSRSFKTSGVGFDAAVQGGVTGCSAPDEANAIVANVTFAGGGQNGYLTAYPFPSVRPNASLVNYASRAIANSTILAICGPSTMLAEGQTCSNHFSVFSSSSSHVVVDMLGYYK